MTTDIVLPALGLMTDPGPFTAAPPGGMAEAQNVVMLRPGVIEPRPGAQFILDTTLNAGSYVVDAVYSDPMDGLFTWSSVSGAGSSWIIRKNPSTITGPTSFTIGKIRAEATGGRSLFTSNHGVCTLPGQAASPASGSSTIAYRAGMPQPYCPRMLTASVPAGFPAGGNWLPNGESVAYRVTLRRRLANGTIVESAPSGRIVVTNSAGAARSVLLTDVLGTVYYAWNQGSGIGLQLYDQLIAGDELCVYRAPRIAGTPSDEMKLRAVLPWDVTFGGFLNWYDALDDSAWTGAALYTNETQEGAAFANYRPEYARDIALYNGMTFYAGATSAQRVDVTLKGLGTTGAPPTDYSQKLLTFQTTGNTVAGVAQITGVPAADIGKFSPGQVVTLVAQAPGAASATFSADTQVTAVNASTNVVTLNKNALTTGAITCIGWDWIESSVAGSRIYYDTGVGTVPARFFSSSSAQLDNRWNGDLATAVQLRCTAVSQTDNILVSFFRPSCTDASFSVRSSKPYAWDRYVDYQTGVASVVDGGVAELRWSKTNEPEHLPVPYRSTIGDATTPIRRIMALRNSLLILKDDGLFQAFGQLPGELAFELLDRTILIPAPLATTGDYADPHSKWALRYDDRAYVMSTRGPMAVTDSGGSLVGAPILETLRYNLGDLYGASSNVVGAMAADVSARRVIWFANGTGYVMDVDTGVWTTWTFRGDWVSAACQRPSVSLTASLFGVNTVPWFFCAGPSTCVMSKRDRITTPSSKAGGATDIRSRSDVWFGLTATVASVTGTGPYTVTINAGSKWVPTVGDIILDGGGSTYCVVTSVTSATIFTTDNNPGTGTREWFEGFECRCVWVGNAQDNLGTAKVVQHVRFPFSSTLMFSRYVDPTESTGRMKTYFRGYRNPDAAVEQYIDADQSLGDPPFPVVATYKVADVPQSVAEDWALQAGFSIQQAGAWFSTAGIIYEYAEGGSGVERS